MTTPPWKASGAPSSWNWSIAAVSAPAPRPERKSSTTSKRSTIASAPIARWTIIRPLTSNSLTTNQMTRFYCPLFRSKPILLLLLVLDSDPAGAYLQLSLSKVAAPRAADLERLSKLKTGQVRPRQVNKNMGTSDLWEFIARNFRLPSVSFSFLHPAPILTQRRPTEPI